MDVPCSRCEKGIPEGVPLWTVSLQKEILKGDEIEVLEATAYYAFCEECAQHVDFENMDLPEKGGEPDEGGDA